MSAGTLFATRRSRSSLSRSARSTLAVRSIERRVISTATQRSSAEPATSASSSTPGGQGMPAERASQPERDFRARGGDQHQRSEDDERGASGTVVGESSANQEPRRVS
jgi:hypothetical protein